MNKKKMRNVKQRKGLLIKESKPSKFIEICRLLCSYLIDFLSMSTIHGFLHFTQRKRHPLEIVIWIVLVGMATYGAITLSQITLARYNDNPTVISMERDRYSWNTSFPAATICPTFKVNEEKLDEYIEKSSLQNKTYLRLFLLSLSEASYKNFDTVIKYDSINSEDYMSILLQIQFDFKPSVSNSGIGAPQFSLQKVISEMGICYSLNSKLAVYNTPEYWKDNHWNFVEGNDTFYVNPLDGEVFANIVNMSTGFDIYMHGPYEVADIASKSINSPNGYFLQLYLSGLTLFSSDRIRNLGINQRKCRFYDESNLKHSPVYSYVLCREECRASLAKKLCGCLPHFYRRIGNEPVCNVSGLHCLAKYKEQLILLEGECSCLPNCDEVNYIVEDLDTREWFLGSNLQWGLKEYPKMRLRRDVMFGFSDLLVYIGGMAGLFLGCSVLSFIEIFYFFSIRLAWHIIHYHNQKRN